jgi:hypothetical protein
MPRHESFRPFGRFEGPEMYKVLSYEAVRRAVFVEGLSRRETVEDHALVGAQGMLCDDRRIEVVFPEKRFLQVFLRGAILIFHGRQIEHACRRCAFAQQ